MRLERVSIISVKQNGSFSEKKIPLCQIQYGRNSVIIEFNTRNIWKYV